MSLSSSLRRRGVVTVLLFVPSLALTHAMGTTSPIPFVDDDPLLGRWEWNRTSYGGIGNTMEFATADQLVFTYTVLLNGSYRTEGDRLMVRMQPTSQAASEPAREDTVLFAVHGDSLLRWMPPHPDTLVASRVPASKSRAGLTGQWSYPYAQRMSPALARMPGIKDAIVFESFTANGGFHFRIPLRAMPMSYRRQADTLLVDGALFAGGHGRLQWRVEHDTLYITPLDGSNRSAALYV